MLENEEDRQKWSKAASANDIRGAKCFGWPTSYTMRFSSLLLNAWRLPVSEWLP